MGAGSFSQANRQHAPPTDAETGPLMPDTIVVLDFGSQYAQLIARRLREAHVFCELFPWDADAGRVMAVHPKGFILSGGPKSVYEAGAPFIQDYIFDSHLPILGICYGMQALTHALGGRWTHLPNVSTVRRASRLLPNQALETHAGVDVARGSHYAHAGWFRCAGAIGEQPWQPSATCSASISAFSSTPKCAIHPTASSS
jgi:hypothetical protein